MTGDIERAALRAAGLAMLGRKGVMADVSSSWDVQTLRALPGYPWLPCPICSGTEGCDHTVPERARAALPGLVIPTPIAEGRK